MVGPAYRVHTNSSGKRNSSKTLFRPDEFEKEWPFVFLSTVSSLKTDDFQNDDLASLAKLLQSFSNSKMISDVVCVFSP